MSDVKIIINKISSWQRSSSFKERNDGDTISEQIEKSIASWKHDELENGKIIFILNANTTIIKVDGGGGDEEWILTITYNYKFIIKREILLEKIKIKTKNLEIPAQFDINAPMPNYRRIEHYRRIERGEFNDEYNVEFVGF